jgi:hypothetical protein
VVVVLVLAIASLKPADATLQCQGNFQITKYGPIDTPYCEESRSPSWPKARDGTCLLLRFIIILSRRSKSAQPSPGMHG